MGKRRSPQYPCGVCKSNCKPEDWSVFCDSCQSWFHDDCEGLSEQQMNDLATFDEEFLCTACTQVEGSFNFLASINRLGNAAAGGIAKLRTAIQFEEILLRGYDGKFPTNTVYLETRDIDRVAESYFKKMGEAKGMQTVSVKGDGNCLFNALSVTVTGDERASTKIRVLTAIEMMKFEHQYAPQLTAKDMHLVSPDYDEAIIDCSRLGNFSSAWTIQAAASVIQRDILSAYPPMNGAFDQTFKILNTKFQSRKQNTSAPVHIMWTNVAPPKAFGTWTPNHFVPLLPSSLPSVRPIDLEKPIDTSFHSLIPETPSCSPIDDPDDPVFTYDRSESHESQDVVFSSTPSKSRKRQLNSSSSDSPEPTPENPLPIDGKFLSTAQILDMLKSDKCVREDIPSGKKDNVFFLLKNDVSLCDDCGVWDSKKGSTVNSYFILDSFSKPKTIYYKNNLWCTESRSKGKKTWIPIEPQPSDDVIIKLHKYFAVLKGDEQYKKRCTSVIAPCFPPITVVEYCGVKSKLDSVHGNAKRQKLSYFRTHPKVMKKIGEAVKVKPPREVYQDMCENSFEAPRNFKQIRDKKYNDQKKGHQQYRNNIADEVLSVIGMLKDNPYVRKVIMDKGKAPCVILYSDEQIEDLKKNIIKGSVLGVDRTFNLGACFVTTTVYKNMSVTHRESGKSPLFLGPMYLHWDADFETYHSFFSHLQVKLYDCLISNTEIMIGSDQELALVKAIKCCFPSTNHILCSKHLKDNITRYLCDKIGCPTKDRNAIVNLIFGDNGILKSPDLYTFEHKCVSLMPFLEEYPQFRTYFEKLKPMLFSNVCEPYQKGNFVKLWTNNNCESLNNILKLTLDWKPQKLPELVDKLIKVSKLQILDLRRALYGEGNYIVIPKFVKKYCVARDVWLQKDEDEKNKLLMDFILKKKCTKSKDIYATNVNFSVPTTPKIAKKPHQRKRSKSERTR